MPKNACHDTPREVFFSSNYAKAKEVCKGCRMTDECLEIALDFEKPGVDRFGVYGSMTANERNLKYGRTV